ncbi:nudix hydrolase 8-like [Panicum miliaceum]|uniref:Nudix hydrolase 8-like n=1 Tax=Panicum miliaceum TaxID=4540 RepID=A0A3L6RUV5_PANMI|nr:nudix hydrolase 8-like [Panicum miliaceum]
MEGSLLVDPAAASLRATTAARGRRAAGRSGAGFLSCPCSSSRGEPATRAWASYSSAGNMPSRAVKSVSRVNGWNGNGHGWAAAREESSVLEAMEDEYGGMVVDADRLPSDTSGFARSLAASLSYWKSADKKGVWLKLPLDRSEFIPLAVKEGFRYHHAEETYLMLTYWIPDEPCLLPANASHQVGVGGFVISDRMEEKYSASTSLGVWKVPTGFIHASEEIFTGAVREVKEETGIDTEFMELIAFRHAHNVAFQKSDLFFICVLRPLTNEIKIDETEIQAAKWMPLPEFMEQPFIQEDHMFRKISDICVQRLRRRYCGLTAHHVVSKFDGGASTLYYNVAEPERGDTSCDAAA